MGLICKTGKTRQNHLEEVALGWCYVDLFFFVFFAVDAVTAFGLQRGLCYSPLKFPWTQLPPPGFPDLKSEHTAFALSSAVLQKKQLFAWIFNGAHTAAPSRQMRTWRITSIPDFSRFKSPPLRNVKRFVRWVQRQEMLWVRRMTPAAEQSNATSDVRLLGRGVNLHLWYCIDSLENGGKFSDYQRIISFTSWVIFI